LIGREVNSDIQEVQIILIVLCENVKSWVVDTGIFTIYIEINPSAPPIKIGATREEVGHVMGA